MRYSVLALLLFDRSVTLFSPYIYSIAAIVLICLTVFIQNLVAAIAHRKQSQYVPGKVSEDLSHDSFVFRSHRTFHNSLENIHQFTLPAILSMFIGVSPLFLAIRCWVYAVSRPVHMWLYYGIATEKNPSPRSYFFMLGVLVNLVLFGLILSELLF